MDPVADVEEIEDAVVIGAEEEDEEDLEDPEEEEHPKSSYNLIDCQECL
jgi:hypothetical protein